MSLDNLKLRVRYSGGDTESRMERGKLHGLRRALWKSYQAETAIIFDQSELANNDETNGKEFKCLINPSNLKENYDDKTISIPYKDIQLNAEKVENTKTRYGLTDIKISQGDIFKWKNTNTYWLVYLQHIEESAYFRAEIRRCDYQVQIDDKYYWAYVRGPVETEIQWNQKDQKSWNEMNYSLIMYFTKDEKTENFFHRFARLKFLGNTYEVATVDSISTKGIITVCLNEYFNNEFDDVVKELSVVENQYIKGETTVYSYDTYTYTSTLNDGEWSLDTTTKAYIEEQDSETVKIYIVTGRSGTINLIYNSKSLGEIIFPITIESST